MKIIPQLLHEREGERFYETRKQTTFEHSIKPFAFVRELRGCNIIYVLSEDICKAEIFNIRLSGYVLKPYSDEAIGKELTDLRYPVDMTISFME